MNIAHGLLQRFNIAAAATRSFSVEEALQLMKGNDIHRLLITKGGILVGVVTAMDILKFITK